MCIGLYVGIVRFELKFYIMYFVPDRFIFLSVSMFIYLSVVDPEWASYTLGVFLCFECCGVHRALGTHLTRTKSIKVDNWDDEQVLVSATRFYELLCRCSMKHNVICY